MHKAKIQAEGQNTDKGLKTSYTLKHKLRANTQAKRLNSSLRLNTCKML